MSVADKNVGIGNGEVAQAGGLKNLEMGVDLMHRIFEIRADLIEEGVKDRFSVADDIASRAKSGKSASAFGAIEVDAQVEINCADVGNRLGYRFQRAFIDSKEPIDKRVELDKVGELMIDGGGKEEIWVRRFDSPKDGSG